MEFAGFLVYVVYIYAFPSVFFLLFCKQFSYYIHQRQRHVFALLFVDTMMPFDVNFLPSLSFQCLDVPVNVVEEDPVLPKPFI